MKAEKNKISPILQAFLENKDAIERYLRKYLNSAEDIEDCAQEAFLRSFLAESREKIDSPKAYLFMAAKNVALNELAKRANSSTRHIEDMENPTVIVDEKHVAADETLDSRRKLAVLAEAICHMPPKCRQVFIMRKVDGFRVREIAIKLNISVSAVEKHIATGLVKCHDYFSAHGYDPSEFRKMASGGGLASYGRTKALEADDER